MRRIEVQKVDGDEYRGKRYGPETLRHVVTDEDVAFYHNDALVCLLLKKRLSAAAVRAAYPILRAIDAPPTNRHTTVLGRSEVASRLDGRQGRTMRISLRDHPEVRGQSSAIIGYYDRSVRWPYCRATAFNLAYPDKFASLLPYIVEVDRVFAAHTPERYAVQRAFADKLDGAWRIPQTVFTTVTVNRNYAAACHKDAGDLRAGFGVMTAFRAGQYEGGLTYWPAYGFGIKMDTGDVCLADVHEWHGVTDLVGKPGRFERVSCVFYCREKMCHCGSPAEELERARARVAGDPLYDEEETNA